MRAPLTSARSLAQQGRANPAAEAAIRASNDILAADNRGVAQNAVLVGAGSEQPCSKLGPDGRLV